MALGLVSPGVLVREVDRTVGAVDASFGVVGALAGPFSQGPVEEPVIITSEKQLIDNFGKPSLDDNHYEYWYAASDFMSYGGAVSLVRCDGDNLRTSNYAVSGEDTSALKIKNYDDYQDQKNTTSWYFAAKNPGSWFNGLKVCIIDSAADQTITPADTADLAGMSVGAAVDVPLTNVKIASAGKVETFTGSLTGVVTKVGSETFDVKLTQRGGVDIEYKEGARSLSIKEADVIDVGGATITVSKVSDWYNSQTLGLANSTVYWSSIADKPGTSEYARERNSKGDQIHVIVIDEKGSISGVAGQILEKNLFLSKGKDARDQGVITYYKDYLALYSAFLYAGKSIGRDEALIDSSSGDFGQEVQGVTFNSVGSHNISLTGGADYTADGGYETTLANVVTSYELFKRDEFDIDFLIMGPGLATLEETQAKAMTLLDIAEERKDCIACVSPPKSAVVGRSNIDDARDSVLEFFGPLKSTSYGVFDSGYKYTYDRFNNEFIYLPLNADIAGMMVRTELNVYPWYSPAGVQRGAVNNIVKLAYDPPQSHRDALYKNRVNPVISNKGGGFILFGDKTALSYNSAFDRINVRRLFLVVEKAIKAAANTQLFEFNDSITRSTFVNIVSPYLRDVQAKRGITDFLLVCDDSNNTPDVIDRNEFLADIYIKPARSINFIGLTFVATRTGVSFEEVVGTV